MNLVFAGLVLISVVVAAFTGRMGALTTATVASARTAVELALGLLGQMTLWLGLVGVLDAAGALPRLSRGLTPVLRRLFPAVPADHPAMGAMVMNLAANVLGLGNAATPLGLKAMKALDALNPRPGVATNAMALFLAINTAGVGALPLNAVGLRAAAGSADPAGIIVPTVLASLTATVVAALVARSLEGTRWFRLPDAPPPAQPTITEEAAPALPTASRTARWIARVVALALLVAVLRFAVTAAGPVKDRLEALNSQWLLPLLVAGMVLIGLAGGARVYQAFVAAGKEGFTTVVSIIPFLVAMLVAIGLFRASGALDVMVSVLEPVTGLIGFPPQAVPMALLRPFSGSGSMAVMTDVLKTEGPDSFVGYLVSVMNGSTETTFYVLALYGGAAGLKDLRHTVLACVTADVVGPLAAFLLCRLFFGG